MAKVLSPWCKQVKCELIKRDMSIAELAEIVGISRQYASEIVNGRRYSEPAVKAISDVLNVAECAQSLAGN